MSSLFSIQPGQLALLAAAIGVLIASDLTPDEQNVVGNFLQSLGQSILTYAAQAQAQQDEQANKDQTQFICQQIESLNMQVNFLQRQLKNK